MYINKIELIDKKTLRVSLENVFATEFAGEFLEDAGNFAEEFSSELARSIKNKYPHFKKGVIKVVIGTILVATFYVSNGNITIYSESEIIVPINRREAYNMSYLYFGTAASQIDLLANTNGALNMVSPSYFDISESGNLVITELYTPSFIQEAHKKGVRIVPFLSNHWNSAKGEAALKNREKLAQQIAAAIEKYNLDGVNVDIENMTHEHRDMYTDFIKILREKVPDGKEVSVSVAANPFELNLGWQGSYDYKKLSEYADYIVIMAYDEHYRGGEPGPVASLSFVEKSIRYALKNTEAEKIVLGLPFYGRYWRLGSADGGYGINLNTVAALLEKYDSKVHFDDFSKTPVATLTIHAGDPEPIVGGTSLKAGTYQIYFEDSTSIREKLMLVNKYNLKGSATWSLGQEPAGVWDYYKTWSSNVYLADIASHWARDEILAAASRGDMLGTRVGYFEPSREITRAEFVTLLLRKLRAQADAGAQNPFKDVTAHWAKNEISAAARLGIVKGDENGNFHPDKAITRGEAALLIARAFGFTPPPGGKIKFSDVSKGTEIGDAIYAAAEKGIFNGYSDGTFNANIGLSRAQAAVISGRIRGF